MGMARGGVFPAGFLLKESPRTTRRSETSLSQALPFDQVCSDRQEGQCILETTGRRALKAASSISKPVDTKSPVREHMMVTTAMAAFSTRSKSQMVAEE